MITDEKLLTLLLALGLLGSTVPVLAAEEPQAEPIPAWAYGEVADIYAMGLAGDEIYTDHDKPVTQEQLDKMTQVAADKLALLGVEQRSNAGSFVLDTTRGGVLNACIWRPSPMPLRASMPGRWSFFPPWAWSTATARTWLWTGPVPSWRPPASLTG